MKAVKHLFFRFWYGSTRWNIDPFEFEYIWFPRNKDGLRYGLEFAVITVFNHSLIYSRHWD